MFIVVVEQRHVRHHPHAPGALRIPAASSGTALVNPDFAALARAYGLHGEVVTKTADFAAAFERAWAAPQAALIELQVDPDAITPRTTLSAIRAEAQKAGS